MVAANRMLRRSLGRARLGLMLVVITAAALFSWRTADRTTTRAADDLFLPQQMARANVNTDRAIAQLQARLAEFPDDSPAYANLGLAYLQKARETGDPTYYDWAEAALEITLKRSPGDYAALCGMGTLALARHHFGEALEWGQQAQAVNPDHSYAYGITADAQIELGLYEEAVETLQTMVDLRPDISSYARISYIRELYGQTGQAVEAMRWAADGGSPGTENGAWTRTQLGNLYFNQGDLTQAEVEYRRALEGYPGYAYALAGLGRTAAARGDLDQAARLVEKSSATIPLPEFVILLAEIYEAAGRSEDAQRQIDLLYAMQHMYQASGVVMDLELALVQADYRIDLAETVEQARQGYEQRPSIYAADVLAWALYQSGEYAEAREYSRQALRLGTRDALKLFHAGMIHYRLGETGAARRYLEQALETNPHFSLRYAPEARRVLGQLLAEDR